MTAPHDAPRRFEDELPARRIRLRTDVVRQRSVGPSARAIANARQLCDIHLHGRCHLSVVDVHEDPAAVVSSQMLATPTLVRNLPLPVRRVVGDLSDIDKVLRALDLPPVRPTPTVPG